MTGGGRTENKTGIRMNKESKKKRMLKYSKDRNWKWKQQKNEGGKLNKSYREY